MNILLNICRWLWSLLPKSWQAALERPAIRVHSWLVRPHSYTRWAAHIEPHARDKEPMLAACAREALPRLGVYVDPLESSPGSGRRMRRTLRSLQAQWLPLEPVHSLDDLIGIDGLLLLTAGDLLPPWVGAACVLELRRNPNAELLYSDQDWLTRVGQRADPEFFGAFDPVRFSYEKTLPGLVLRRVAEDGYASWPLGAGRKALIEHWLDRVAPEAVQHLPGVFLHRERMSKPPRVSVKLCDSAGPASAEPLPMVSCIIPTRNGREHVSRCIESIYKKTQYPEFEILLIDNQSDDPAAKRYFRELEDAGLVRLLDYDAPFNYSAINNYGAAQARGELLLLLNNDTEVVDPDWMSKLAQWATRQENGCVGARLLYPDGSIQHAGVITGLGLLAGHPHRFAVNSAAGYGRRMCYPQRVSAVTAACLMVRRKVFEAVGGLNERDLPVAFNDVDFCLRVKERGWHNIWLPDVSLIHYESVSRGQDDTPEKKARFAGEAAYLQSRWKTHEKVDPYYSPYLSRESEDFALRADPTPYRPWLEPNGLG